MQLKIEYQPWYHRPWLIKRIHGTYEQHAHCFTKKDIIILKRIGRKKVADIVGRYKTIS